VHNGLQGRDASKVTMEDIERCVIPSGGPQEDVVSSGEHPYERKVSVTQNSSSIGNISPHLRWNFCPAANQFSISEQIRYGD
jgi:hypothetical protein